MTEEAMRSAAAASRHASDFKPRVGIILGSGLGGLADKVEDAISVGYDDLPGFPQPSVEGHAGRLVMGMLGGVPVACLQGRVHFYEGLPPQTVQTPVRMLKLLGCEVLLVSNAAGSLREEAGPGSLMMITDHINMLPGNPLTGPNDDRFGPRFPPMDGAYDQDLQSLLRSAAEANAVTLHEGVYVACLGPCFETPAEIRAFRTLGADAVGMSTVPEVIVARHCGLRVAGVSVLTNLAAGLSDMELSHDQTLHYAGLAATDMEKLVTAFLARLGEEAEGTA
jgi:xanthosine phosphorylase